MTKDSVKVLANIIANAVADIARAEAMHRDSWSEISDLQDNIVTLLQACGACDDDPVGEGTD